MKTFLKQSAAFWICLILSFPSLCKAKGTFGVDVAAGAPHLISLEFSYWGLGPFVLGVGFGSLPVDSILKRAIPMSSHTLSNGFILTPLAGYSFLTISAFGRWFPFAQNHESGTFLEINIARWRFGTNVSGDLTDPSDGAVINGALTGSIDFQQPVVTAALGYRGMISSNFFMHCAVGATYLVVPTYTVDVGGSLTSVMPFADQATIDSYNNAKQDISTQVDQGVQKVRSITTVVPALWLNIGWLI